MADTPQTVELDDFTGAPEDVPDSEGAEPDRLDRPGGGTPTGASGASSGAGGAEGTIVYSPERLLQFAQYLEEAILPLCQYGADRSAGIGDVQTGYFQHGFEVRQFCADIEDIQVHNFESFATGLRILIEGFRIVAHRYTKANEETEDLVADLQVYVDHANTQFANAGFIEGFEPEPAAGDWKDEPAGSTDGDGGSQARPPSREPVQPAGSRH